MLFAERRNAVSSLDYALVSGTDGAAGRRAEVEALMKKTAEEVRLGIVIACPITLYMLVSTLV